MRSKLAIIIVLMASNFFAQVPPQAQKPLGSVELLALQIDGVSSDRLAKIVAERGIDFQPEGTSFKRWRRQGPKTICLLR